MFLGNVNTSFHKLFSKSSPSSLLRNRDDSAFKNAVHSKGIKQMELRANGVKHGKDLIAFFVGGLFDFCDRLFNVAGS